MINPTGNKLEKLLFGVFDDTIRGVDIYNHNGTMWLIFTDQMKWVVEYTKDQTLWYNYHLFEQEMGFVGLNCLDHKEIIRKWFESRFLKQLELVKFIQNPILPKEFDVEEVIQNGTPMGEIKYVRPHWSLEESSIEEVIQSGVKEIYDDCTNNVARVEGVVRIGKKMN
jgi:hypothetical protein